MMMLCWVHYKISVVVSNLLRSGHLSFKQNFLLQGEWHLTNFTGCLIRRKICKGQANNQKSHTKKNSFLEFNIHNLFLCLYHRTISQVLSYIIIYFKTGVTNTKTQNNLLRWRIEYMLKLFCIIVFKKPVCF